MHSMKMTRTEPKEMADAVNHVRRFCRQILRQAKVMLSFSFCKSNWLYRTHGLDWFQLANTKQGNPGDEIGANEDDQWT